MVTSNVYTLLTTAGSALATVTVTEIVFGVGLALKPRRLFAYNYQFPLPISDTSKAFEKAKFLLPQNVVPSCAP